MKKDQHNATRIQFLNHLDQWAGEREDSHKKDLIHRWVLERLSDTMKTLRKPLKAEQEVLLAEAKVFGGIDYLNDQ